MTVHNMAVRFTNPSKVQVGLIMTKVLVMASGNKGQPNGTRNQRNLRQFVAATQCPPHLLYPNSSALDALEYTVYKDT
jgi:hypothetical protein